MEEAIIELHLARVSVRCIKDITETLWGNKKYMNMKHLEIAPEDVSIAGLTSLISEPANHFAKSF